MPNHRACLRVARVGVGAILDQDGWRRNETARWQLSSLRAAFDAAGATSCRAPPCCSRMRQTGAASNMSHTPSSLPRHVGFIPDGNRRWAGMRQLPKEAGYARGIDPGLVLFEECRALGIEEVSVYGFTQDNTRRPSVQTRSFRDACVQFAL